MIKTGSNGYFLVSISTAIKRLKAKASVDGIKANDSDARRVAANANKFIQWQKDSEKLQEFKKELESVLKMHEVAKDRADRLQGQLNHAHKQLEVASGRIEEFQRLAHTLQEALNDQNRPDEVVRNFRTLMQQAEFSDKYKGGEYSAETRANLRAIFD